MGQVAQIDFLRGIDFPQYYLNLLKNVLRRQRLNLFDHYEKLQIFEITPELQKRWDFLFGLDPSVEKRPLQTFYSRLSSECLFEALSMLKVNFANIMHLAVDIDIPRPFEGFQSGQKYFYDFVLDQVTHLNHNRATLSFRSVVMNRAGVVLLTHTDTMFVSKLSEADVQRLRAHGRGKFEGIKKSERCLDKEHAENETVYLSRDAGMEYGIVSGDLNPLHTNLRISKLMGHEKSFVQGLYSTNLALKFLGQRNLKRLRLRFVSPAYVEQNVVLLSQDGRMEMHDENGKLLTSGEFEVFS